MVLHTTHQELNRKQKWCSRLGQRTPAWLLVLGFGAGCAASPAAKDATSPSELATALTAPAAPAHMATASGPALLPNSRTPVPGVLSGGAPTDAQLAELQKQGYLTVVSLLPDSDGEEATVTSLGMEFVAIPISGPDDLTEDNALTLWALLEQDAKMPIALHCASGNRAGALFALAQFYGGGKTAQEALTLGEAAGLSSLRPVVAKQLGLTDSPTTP